MDRKLCGNEPLSVSFPSLVALDSSKEAWVVDLWHHSKERCVWTPTFSRRLNDWEIKVVEHFLARLQEGATVKGGEDKMCWLETEWNFLHQVPLL